MSDSKWTAEDHLQLYEEWERRNPPKPPPPIKYAKGNTPGGRDRLKRRMSAVCGPLATVDIYQSQGGRSPKEPLRMGILVRCTRCVDDEWWVSGESFREVAAKWTEHLNNHPPKPPPVVPRTPVAKPVYVGITIGEAAAKTGVRANRIKSLIKQGVLHNYGSNTTPRVDLTQLSLVQWESYKTI